MNGTRLGRGRGIYDSILSNYSDSVFIGITDENHICKSIPFDDHDVPMNALVTPKGLYQLIYSILNLWM